MKKRLSIVSVLGFLLIIKDVSADVIMPAMAPGETIFLVLGIHNLYIFLPEIIILIVMISVGVIILVKIIKRNKKKNNLDIK